MRIENLLLNNINLNNSDNILREGSIFKGEILEILEEFVLIDIIGQGIIKATSESDIKSLIGNEMSFLVKSHVDGKMEIKPLIDEETSTHNLTSKADSSISKILNKFNIKETKLSIDLVENLMKYNAPINEKNIMDGVKGLEKLMELMSLGEDDKVVLFENTISDDVQVTQKEELVPKESLMAKTEESLVTKEDLKSNELDLKKVIVEDPFVEDTKAPEKTNIKNLLIVDKNSYPEKEDISNLVQEFLKNETKTEGEEFNKILSFFTKNEIEPSLNNIKNLRELIKDPIEFSKDFEKLNLLIDKLKDEGSFTKVKDFTSHIQLDKEGIEESKENIKLLQKIIGETEDKTVLASNPKKEINELENKIDFLKEMDQNMSFLFLPINHGERELDGILTLLKEKRKKKSMDDKINVFINLNTHNLGTIKISCVTNQEMLSVKMYIRKSDLKLFQSAKQGLIDRIGSIGYTVEKIDFLVDEEINMMDTIATNPNPNYFLDIKV